MVVFLRCSIIVVLALLAGCGFQLRGAGLAESQLNIAVINGLSTPSSAYADFMRTLEGTAARSGSSQDGTVDVTLRVQGFAFEIEDGAVDAQVRVVEKIARLTVEVAALDALGEALAEPWIIEVSQAFRTDRTQLLGSFGQQSQIEEALYQNVASRIVRSLDVLIRMRAGEAQAGIPGSESDAG